MNPDGDPDRNQNLIDCSLRHAHPSIQKFHKISQISLDVDLYPWIRIMIWIRDNIRMDHCQNLND